VDTPPRPPSGLGVSGRRLWRAIVRDYEPSPAELELLRQACRTADVLDQLDAVADAEGVTIDSPQGVKAHPATVEGRQQRLAFVRQLAALGLDADEAAGAGPGAASRPPAGSAPSGLYAVPGSS
jgi:hypothetical protein